ncbi:MAG: two-component sensor histidine kinase [Rhodobacteraceae bacterium]|nr:two-component sensor histidine kinase [Paracoccaceae bacterium]
MLFGWMKRYVPRSLYGRAALILIAPVVTIQLVLSIVFIQRHYEGVTRQMTSSVVYELQYALDVLNSAPSLKVAQQEAERLGKSLAMTIEIPSSYPAYEERKFYDLSGRVMIETVRDKIDSLQAVDLASTIRTVSFRFETRWSDVSITLSRRRVAASNPHQLLVLMVFVSILLTVIAYIFLRNQLRPIKQMAAAAEEFGKGRIVPFKPTGALEVRSAGNAFLDMRSRIDRHIEQRTMMLSGVSHDLRTPLTRLKLGLSMIEQTSDAKELQRDVADMERLIDEFLAFARGDLVDEIQSVDPIALLEEAVRRARVDGMEVSITSATSDGRASLRPMAMERALENLIGNALRYGSRAGVSVCMDEHKVRFTVEDDGPGIPEDQREQAVQPFVRLDNARNQDRGSGVGLGLAIANDIARRHGGSLTLSKSQSLGGLRIDLSLPR